LENILYTGAGTDNRHYEHDLVGNLLAVTYPNDVGSVRESGHLFDKLNRLIEETSAGATHVHTYDKANNRRTTVYAGTARTLVSTYDKLNRLLTLAESGAGVSPAAITTYGYDLNGNITRKTLPNGTETRCTFDASNRKLGETSQQSGGAVISSFDYSQPVPPYPTGYDEVGNVLKVVEQYGHASVNDRTVTNTYDRTYRLDVETIAETGGSTSVTEYAYDDANNRTGKTVTENGGTPTDWTFVPGTFAEGYNSNQIKSVSDGTTTTTFLYDLNGNRSEKQVGGVTTQTYTWDHENRLTQVTDSSLGTYSYSYDHRTRRVLRDETSACGQSDDVSFAGGLSVQEYQTGQTSPFVEYIRGSDYGGGIGGVLYTIRGSARSYNAYNSRGDVVSKTDESAAITWQSSYEAFGTRTQEQGTTADRQKANTKDEDAWGGLNEGMRYRDLEFGIFLSRDPAGFVDGPNVYTYVRQNPWTYYDPYGLNMFNDVVGGLWNGVSIAANEVGHGIAQAGVMVEIAGREAANGVAGAFGGSVNTEVAYDRLNSVTNHKESYGKEIADGTAAVTGADQSTKAFGGATFVGELAFPDPGKKGTMAIKGGQTLVSKLDEGADLAGKTARGIGEEVAGAVNRLPRDVTVNTTAPDALPLNRPIGRSPTQNARAQRHAEKLQGAGAQDVRINQQQINGAGERVGINRPDLSYTNPKTGQRVNVEYERTGSARGEGHRQRIQANDPDTKVRIYNNSN
jgi:RHS repeat-associated protein